MRHAARRGMGSVVTPPRPCVRYTALWRVQRAAVPDISPERESIKKEASPPRTSTNKGRGRDRGDASKDYYNARPGGVSMPLHFPFNCHGTREERARVRETHQHCVIHGAFDLEKYGSGKRGARTGRTSPEKRHKKAPGEGGEHVEAGTYEAGTYEAGAGGNADSLTKPRAPRPDHGTVEGRGAGDKGSSRARRAPGSESGSRIAPRRLRRSALRSASGDGRCSYIPAPSRALYGLVARLTRYAYLIPPESGHRNKEYSPPHQ